MDYNKRQETKRNEEALDQIMGLHSMVDWQHRDAERLCRLLTNIVGNLDGVYHLEVRNMFSNWLYATKLYLEKIEKDMKA